MTDYHDLSASERDALLATATATARQEDIPNKTDVHDAMASLRSESLTKPASYSAISRIADAGAVRIRRINGRSKGVMLTPVGYHLLHDGAEKIAAATKHDYHEHDHD